MLFWILYLLSIALFTVLTAFGVITESVLSAGFFAFAIFGGIGTLVMALGAMMRGQEDQHEFDEYLRRTAQEIGIPPRRR